MSFLTWGGEAHIPQCTLCEVEHPITFVSSRAGDSSLCLACSLRVLSMTVEQFELVHAPYRDHLADRLLAGRDGGVRTLGMARRPGRKP